MKIVSILVLLLASLVAFSACSSSASKSASSISEGAMNKPTDVATGKASQGVVVIQGIFDPTGEKLLELKPVHRYVGHSRPIPNQREGRLVVEVTYVNGKMTTVPFDALVADDSGATRYGFFEVVVPVSGEI